MKKFDFKGKKILIMGLGLLGGGVASARFFAQRGAEVTVTDLRPREKLLPSIKKLAGLSIKFVLEKHKEEDFKEKDLIITNPDVLFTSPYLELARRREIPLEMEESFFVKNCPGKIIGVTGSRGKSTTATLVAKILKEGGEMTVLAGNVAGVGTLDFLEKVTPKTWVVLELSSFQLHGFGESKISPHIAVITNIFPEHLNHYKTLKDYIIDKKNIFHFQGKDDFLVLNKNNAYCREFVKEARAKVLFFSESDVPKNWKLKLTGRHNRENVAAALTVGKILKIPRSTIARTVEKFPSLPYHLEEVRKIKNITFINDGVSTSPEATMAALASFSGSVILLLGGNDKGLDFGELGKLVGQRVRAVFLMAGTATPKIEKAILRKELIRGKFNTLGETVRASFKFAQKGDIILFSPAATSFNWFNNIYHRSREFEKIVKSL